MINKLLDFLKALTPKQWLLIVIVTIWGIAASNIIPIPRLKGAFTSTPKAHFSFATWFDGSYQKQMEAHLSERMVLRNFLIRLNNQIDYSIYNEHKIEWIIRGKNEYLYNDDIIKTHMGATRLPREEIVQKVDSIKVAEKILEDAGIKLFVVIAGSKASYYPEYFPPEYDALEKQESNYDMLVDEFKKKEVTFLDFKDWFIRLKDTISYPVYPKNGLHWSAYGDFLAADSIVKFVGHLEGQEMAELVVHNVSIDSTAQESEEDMEACMNLIFEIPDEALYHADFDFVAKPGQKQPNVLVVSDSFYKEIYLNEVSKQAFNNGQYWYYNNTIYNNQEMVSYFVPQLDFAKEVRKYDVVMLMATEANIIRMPYGFVDMVINKFNSEE